MRECLYFVQEENGLRWRGGVRAAHALFGGLLLLCKSGGSYCLGQLGYVPGNSIPRPPRQGAQRGNIP